MQLTKPERDSPVVTQAVRQADEVGQIARRVLKVHEDLVHGHDRQSGLGRERAPRFDEATRERGERDTGDRSRNMRDRALPSSLAQRRHQACDEQRDGAVGDKKQIAQHPCGQQEYCQNPSRAEASPPESGEGQERVEHRADVKAPADEEQRHGRSAEGEEGDHRHTSGERRRAATAFPGDEHAHQDDKSRHDRGAHVEQRGP